MVKKILLFSMITIAHTTATNKEALKEQIMECIEECSTDKFLQLTNNLEEVKKISPDEWKTFLKQAEFQSETAWGLEKKQYITTKILSAFLLVVYPLLPLSLPERNYDRKNTLGDELMVVFTFATAIFAGTMGMYGLFLENWKCDKANEIIKMINYRIKTIKDALEEEKSEITQTTI